MTPKDYIKFGWLNTKRIHHGLRAHPIFTTQLLYKRAQYFLTGKFAGPTIISPLTGEPIFNIQSLIIYWAFHCIKELGTEWENHIRETAAPVVYDVGSNLGQFRRYILSLNHGARVTTIDAWREMSCYIPSGSSHYSIAASDKDGIVTLRKNNNYLTATTDTSEEFAYYRGEQVDVKSSTLDKLWHGENVDLLKMDIDGGEVLALRGAQRMLEKTKILVVETTHIDEVTILAKNRRWTSANNLDWVGTQKIS